VELGEDLISLVCLELNTRALVSSWKVKTWMPWMWGGWGIYSPNHHKVAVGRLQSHGAPDSPVRHRTLSDAPGASHVSRPLEIDRWALSCEPAWLSGGAPDRPCRLFGVPPARALLLCARRRAFNALQSTVARELAVSPLSHRTVRCAPDTVRWLTGQSGEF
jgi:hypothetical protein